MHAAIIGCGTAGQASAIFLARQGHCVTLFERVKEPKPVGAGLLLQPTGLGVLAHLGVLEGVLARGSAVHRLLGTTTSGRAVLDMGYADLDKRLFGLGIQRGSLFGVLQRAVEGASIKLVCDVEAISSEQSSESVSFRDTKDNVHGPFDLLIVADGARSRLRSSCGLKCRVRQYPWAALWCVLDDPDSRYSHVLRQIYKDTRGMLGFLPAGCREPGSRPTVTMFWSVRASEIETVRQHGVDAWKSQVKALSTLADPVLDQVTSMGQLISANYFDVLMPTTALGRAVFIGDAAHATSPQLGQGANLALVDAAELATALQDVGRDRVPDALLTFAQARRKHTAFYQVASRWLTPIFQSALWPIAPVRDRVFEPVSRIPWVRRQMVLSLAGTKDGIFSQRSLVPVDLPQQVSGYNAAFTPLSETSVLSTAMEG